MKLLKNKLFGQVSVQERNPVSWQVRGQISRQVSRQLLGQVFDEIKESGG